MYRFIVFFRSRVLVLLTHHLALPLLKVIRKPKVFPHTRNDLMSLGEGTLGYDLAELLDKNNFQLLTHYAKHDMKHILLDYPTTDRGEVCLQAFMLGNGHISFPVVSTLLFGLLTMPEHWSHFRIAYRRERKALSINNWDWNKIVYEPTQELKRRIFSLPD